MTTVWKRYFLGFIFLLILLLPFTYAAAGAAAPPRSARTFSFTPGTEETWTIPVYGADNLEVMITGELAPFVTLQDPNPGAGSRTVEYTIRWSDAVDLLPGDHYFFLQVGEATSGGMVGTRAVVNVVHTGQYYTPEPYLKAGMGLSNIEEGERTKANFNLKSYSTNPIQDIRVSWKVLEPGSEEILFSGENLLLAALPVLAEETAGFEIPTEELAPGKYDVIANLTYEGGEAIILKKSFRVGEFTANLIKSPKVIYRGKINKVLFTVSNAWNLPIPDARFSIAIPELNIIEEAPVAKINAFAQQGFIVYVEPTEEAELKTYEGIATLRLGVGDRAETATLPFTVEVRDPADDVDAAAKQVVTERPSAFSITLNPLVGAYVLVLLLVLVNIYFLWKQNKKK